MVHVDDPRGRWSVSASEVMHIVTAAEWTAGWHGAPAIDVLAPLGALPWARSRRVLVVRGVGGGELALLAAGALEIAEVDPASVLPLPIVLATAVPQISAIIVAPDGALSLLIEPSAVITSGDTVVGEDLCPSHS
jgi:chemotaxis signal transduction protein